mmetsp:Transcript_15862/g.23568  ORF Transcript_15862/g.23568 Transcript_15862/m.23568 type:complete len:111 (-) Transcript_15862:27-359(-)
MVQYITSDEKLKIQRDAHISPTRRYESIDEFHVSKLCDCNLLKASSKGWKERNGETRCEVVDRRKVSFADDYKTDLSLTYYEKDLFYSKGNENTPYLQMDAQSSNCCIII